MTDNKTTEVKNRESLGEYRNPLAGLTEKQLSTPMAAGWTVSAVLCHLAFWDQRAIALLEKWEKDGIEFSPVDVDVTNDATLPLCLAVPPKAAVDLFLQTGQAIDTRLAALSQKQIDEIVEKGKNVHISRADHRVTHLGDIKSALGIA